MTNDFKAKKNNSQSRQLSPQEWAEKKQLEKEEVYQLIDSTAEEVAENPDKLRGFLDVQARMDRYSSANALLIYSRLPKAARLKDFSGWRDENVRVNKGAKSISILEPVDYTKSDGTTGISYNVKKVFDVSQTNGRRKPAPTLNRDPQNLVSVMLDTATVNVESADALQNPNAPSYYDNDRDTLYIKRGVGDSVALFQSVATELGYAELSGMSDSFSRKDMGFQAVCIGYMLCKKYGVDTQSFAIDRIPPEWKDKEPKEIRAELSKMRTAMSDIHTRVSEELYRQQQERSKDRER